MARRKIILATYHPRSHPRSVFNSRLWLLCCFVMYLSPLQPATANEFGPKDAPIPSYADLEKEGAVIGEILITPQDIFDVNDPAENKMLFRLANSLHINTRPDVIRRSLLFKSDEPLSARLIEESERLLRNNRYIYDVNIVPVAYHNGIVDLEVMTRDTWSLDPGISFSRTGGSNSSGLSFKEYNVLGSGIFLGLSRSSNIDRSGNEIEIKNSHAFGGWTEISLAHAKYTDGKRQAVSIINPFYALDKRWAAGVSVWQDQRIDSVFTSGILTGQYSHKQKAAEVFGGWSDGLIDGWTKRSSIGVTLQDDVYGLEPALLTPAALPPDQKLVAPFFRYEVIEDGYQKLKNRDQIERPEYVAMGFQSRVQIGRAMTGLGSTDNFWTYSGSISEGFERASGSTLLTSGSFSGSHGGSGPRSRHVGGLARYYLPQGEHAKFFVSVSGDIARPLPGGELLLGGDNGLRGYPLRYQSGNRRALLTVEQRVYSDWYPFNLFRVGGAAFFDVGRAWGGANQNSDNPGWLADVGFGLRILSARSAFGNVLHIDLAFPLNRTEKIKAVQFLVKTHIGF